MKYYGERPPWEGRNEFLGSWRFVCEDGWVPESYWEFVPPPSAKRGLPSLETLSNIMRNFYLEPLKEEFKTILLPEVFKPKVMTLEQVRARRKKRRWWRR